MKLGSLCDLGRSAPNPVLSTLRHFRSEYEAHINDQACPAGICRDLTAFDIDAEACDGCHACVKSCPVEAIEGERKGLHLLDQDKCISCGVCYDVCPIDAIRFFPKPRGKEADHADAND